VLGVLSAERLVETHAFNGPLSGTTREFNLILNLIQFDWIKQNNSTVVYLPGMTFFPFVFAGML